MNLTPAQLDAIAAFQDAAHARTQAHQESHTANEQADALGAAVKVADERFVAAQKAMREALLGE